MTRYTTPGLTIEVPDVDLTTFDEVHVTFRQDRLNVVLDIPDADIIDAHTLTVQLTQEQSSLFRITDPLRIQLNLLKGETRIASEILTLEVGDNLLREVIGG